MTYSALVYGLFGAACQTFASACKIPFLNAYDPHGARTQTVLPYDSEMIPTPDWGTHDVMHLMPVIGEVSVTDAWLQQQPERSTLVLNAQGWLRTIAETRRVTAKAWDPISADAIFFSSEDVLAAPDFETNARRRTPLLIRTEGSRGAMLFTDAGCYRVSARDVIAVDPTGAGDVFAAAFSASYFVDGKGVERAAAIATVLAAEVVQGEGVSRLQQLGSDPNVMRRIETLADEVCIERL